MKCIYCDVETVAKYNTHKFNYKNKTIIITNVPTEFCNICADEYYSAETVNNLEKILNIVKNYKVKDKKIIVDYGGVIKTLDEISIGNRSELN